MNEYKSHFFLTPTQRHRHRLAVTEQQLTKFWYSKTLTELEKILSIKDQYIIFSIVFEHYLKYFLNYKKISPGELFHVIYKDQTIAYVYDAKIFRNVAFEKYDNDLISTFLIAYREKEDVPNDDVFEFLDYSIVQPQQWILKVKQSAILRIFPFIIHKFLQKRETSYESAMRNPIGGYYISKTPALYHQVVILDPSMYFYYMSSLLPRCEHNVETNVKIVFDIALELILNNLLIAWYSELTEQEKFSRHFKKYFKIIEKPKIKEEFTSTDNKFTEIKWQTLKILAFKLKYILRQTEDHYECIQINLQNQQQLNQPYEDLSIDDANILIAFNKQKALSPSYDQFYTTFYDDVYF